MRIIANYHNGFSLSFSLFSPPPPLSLSPSQQGAYFTVS